jgi:hypothetical protein
MTVKGEGFRLIDAGWIFGKGVSMDAVSAGTRTTADGAEFANSAFSAEGVVVA